MFLETPYLDPSLVDVGVEPGLVPDLNRLRSMVAMGPRPRPWRPVETGAHTSLDMAPIQNFPLYRKNPEVLRALKSRARGFVEC